VRKQFALPWIGTVAIVILLEILAQQFTLFSHPSLGYDKLLHFLGGGACGIFGVAILVSALPYDIAGACDPLCDRGTHNKRVLLFAVTSAFIIGILWEVAQVYLPWLRDASDYDWYDTVGDVIFDVLGGITFAWRYQLRGW
jgi:hypothetical protein